MLIQKITQMVMLNKPSLNLSLVGARSECPGWYKIVVHFEVRLVAYPNA